MIRLENVQKVYGNEIKKIALDNVSFQIEEGEFVAIVGASGSGKSTLLNLLGGMDVATQGNYFFGDVNIATLKNRDLHEFRKSKVSFVFQRYELIHFSVSIFMMRWYNRRHIHWITSRDFSSR